MANISKINVGGTEYDIAPITVYDNWKTDLTNDGRYIYDNNQTVVDINSNESNKYLPMSAGHFLGDMIINIADGTKNCKIFIDLSDYQDISTIFINSEKNMTFINCGVNGPDMLTEHLDGVELGYGGANCCLVLYTGEQSGTFGTFLIEVDELSNVKVYLQFAESI